MVDERSAKNIKTLHPEVAILAAKLIETAVAQGICVKVISGLRTYEELEAVEVLMRPEPPKASSSLDNAHHSTY